MDLGGTPAAWYPDPWQQFPLRWWDGQAWTPYLSPPAAPPLQDEEQPARRARMAIAIAAAAQALSPIASHRALERFVDQLRNLDATERPVFGTDPSFLVTWAAGLVGLAAGIVFLLWFHRSATNALAMGLPARRDPASGVVGFLVPIINLWWPYGSMRDLFPEDDPNRAHVLPWFLVWTVGGIMSGIVSYVAAFIGGGVGWALLVIPVVQVSLAAVLAWRLIGEVVDAHRSRTAGYGSNR